MMLMLMMMLLMMRMMMMMMMMMTKLLTFGTRIADFDALSASADVTGRLVQS